MVSFAQRRKDLVRELELGGIRDKEVLATVSKVPREDFVPESLRDSAYENTALPILKDQTISQPFTVAFMLEVLELKKGLKVLEIGAGSGYNAALISELVKPGKVVTTEIIPEVFEFAKKNLRDYKNVRVTLKDGTKDIKQKFDRIIITAASSKVPESLIEALKDPGILIAPVGPKGCQSMVRITKEDKKIRKGSFGSFVFVPLRH